MNNDERVVLLESDEHKARCYSQYLESVTPRVEIIRSGRQFLSLLPTFVPEVVVIDFEISDIDVIELLSRLNKLNIATIPVVIVPYASSSLLMELMLHGAQDYIERPFTRDRFVTTLINVLKRARLTKANGQGSDSNEKSPQAFEGFVGSSVVMQNVYRTIEAAARSKASVFITGESGTGKEVCAAAMHHKSPRQKKAFVPLNCAAIPRDLMESEIFGHVKGAFTGASVTRNGAAQQADGGTLFLDEIAEMDMRLQSKLLRFVQTGIFQKVGSNQMESVDVRFVCATNKDPLSEISNGRFREDLYYRLNVVHIHLPPLRERITDVLEIARFFLLKFSPEEGRHFESFSPEVEKTLLTYRWPGNVRQLQNVIRNIVVLHDGNEVTFDMLPHPLEQVGGIVHGSAPPERLQQEMNADAMVPMAQGDLVGEPLEPQESSTPRPSEDRSAPSIPLPKGWENEGDIVHLTELEMQAIEKAIVLCGNNITQAAKALGVSPSTIYRKKQSWIRNSRCS